MSVITCCALSKGRSLPFGKGRGWVLNPSKKIGPQRLKTKKGRDSRPSIFNSLVVVRKGGRTAVRPYNSVFGWMVGRTAVRPYNPIFGWMGARTAVRPYNPIILQSYSTISTLVILSP